MVPSLILLTILVRTALSCLPFGGGGAMCCKPQMVCTPAIPMCPAPAAAPPIKVVCCPPPMSCGGGVPPCPSGGGGYMPPPILPPMPAPPMPAYPTSYGAPAYQPSPYQAPVGFKGAAPSVGPPGGYAPPSDYKPHAEAAVTVKTHPDLQDLQQAQQITDMEQEMKPDPVAVESLR
ncbi:unnamed protein product [Cylicocyclus nassatus]|uniref:Uncharacterized protein n=1 Tax=Cylicocyclus nassatus TaxID=53992 RepID=A0AA36GG68_CYLNA|nr:unnamed protein product [Cylicocyclus nassatus]